jgi:glycerol uptake facilitator-like aquaporin
MSHSLASKLLAELIGTFALVFIGAGAASIVGSAAGFGGLTAVAFAHGLTLMIFICAYGRISGGHMNPAVTVGVLVVGAITAAEAAGYIVSQIVGGVAGAILLRIVLGGVATGSARPNSRTASFSAVPQSQSRRRSASWSRRCSPFSWSRPCSAPRSPAAPLTLRRSRSA